MRVDWYGQAAFHLSGREGSVFIDPFGELPGLSSRGIQFDYPAITGVEAKLLLVTHEHFDHNGVDAIGGDPTVLRSTAGRLESPYGEVVAIASEHDEAAGTERGANTIFVFGFDGLRIAHFGDVGQTRSSSGCRTLSGSIRPASTPTRSAARSRWSWCPRLPEPALASASRYCAEWASASRATRCRSRR